MLLLNAGNLTDDTLSMRDPNWNIQQLSRKNVAHSGVHGEVVSPWRSPSLISVTKPVSFPATPRFLQNQKKSD